MASNVWISTDIFVGKDQLRIHDCNPIHMCVVVSVLGLLLNRHAWDWVISASEIHDYVESVIASPPIANNFIARVIRTVEIVPTLVEWFTIKFFCNGAVNLTSKWGYCAEWLKVLGKLFLSKS